MCAPKSGGITPGVSRKPRGGLFAAVIKDFAQAKNPTFNPVDRTIVNWSPNAPQKPAYANPMSVSMAGNSASMAGDAPAQPKASPVADAFLGAADAQKKNQSGYRVVQ